MDISLKQAEKLIAGLPLLTTILKDTVVKVEEELGAIDKEMIDLLTRRELVCGSILDNMTHVADEIDKVLGQDEETDKQGASW